MLGGAALVSVASRLRASPWQLARCGGLAGTYAQSVPGHSRCEAAEQRSHGMPSG